MAIIADGSLTLCTVERAATPMLRNVKGESYVELAEEEAEALDKAIFKDAYDINAKKY